MIDKSTIIKLYNGEVYPASVINPSNPDYKKYSNEVEKIHETLTKMVSAKLINDFRDAIENRDSIVQDETFSAGFAL